MVEDWIRVVIEVFTVPLKASTLHKIDYTK